MSIGMAGAPCRYIYAISAKSMGFMGRRVHAARPSSSRYAASMVPAAQPATGLPGKYGEHDRQAPARRAEHRRQQVQPAVAGRELPAAAGAAPIAVERDALAGDRAAVEIERDREIERRLAQKRGEARQREERFRGGAEDDAAVVVLG